MGEEHPDTVQGARRRVLFQTMGRRAQSQHRAGTGWPHARRVSGYCSQARGVVFKSRQLVGTIGSCLANKKRGIQMNLDEIGPWSEIKLDILRDYAAPY